jgi:hypothetical protein
MIEWPCQLTASGAPHGREGADLTLLVPINLASFFCNNWNVLGLFARG